VPRLAHEHAGRALYSLRQSFDRHGQGVGQNEARLHDDQLDDWLERARNCRNRLNEPPLYSQAQKRLTELVPEVPLYDNTSIVAYQSYVRGLLLTPRTTRRSSPASGLIAAGHEPPALLFIAARRSHVRGARLFAKEARRL